MKSRFVRDGIVLLVFCGAFYLVTFAINWISAAASDVSLQAEFTWDRQQADRYLAQQDWKNAAAHLEKLTENDPFNGHAWYFLGLSRFNQRLPFRDDVRREEYKANSSEARIAELKASAREFSLLARPALEQSLKFPRHCNKARILLARMHAFDGEADLAYKHLADAFNEGYASTTKFGIRGMYDFYYVKDDPKFKELASQELQNRWRRRSR